jgi:hypothetical protein
MKSTQRLQVVAIALILKSSHGIYITSVLITITLQVFIIKINMILLGLIQGLVTQLRVVRSVLTDTENEQSARITERLESSCEL